MGRGIRGRNSTLLIYDPGYPQRLRLNDPAYNNTARSMRIYHNTQSDFSSLEITVSEPAQVLVQNPAGLQTGVSVPGRLPLLQIPNAGYAFEQTYGDPTGQNGPPAPDQGANKLIVKYPASGQYQVSVSGPANTAFTLDVRAANPGANSTELPWD